MTECTHCRKRYEDGVRFCPVDGYAVVPVNSASEPWVGRRLLGQFQIESICGHGATGTVYRAVQAGMDRQVAVKVLRADLVKDTEIVKRFIREARAGAKLNHPNIATVHLVGQTEDGVPFLVMEYVEGSALAALLDASAPGSRGRPLPLSRIVRIGSQIASALSEAHAQGIVHRDLKPENILLSQRRGESDVVKVVDFGIAKMLAHAAPGEDPISRMGTVFGTPHYIAPEQASGQPVDGRADLYSLGSALRASDQITAAQDAYNEPAVGRSVEVEVEIDAKGKTKSVVAKDNEVKDAGVAKCLEGVIKKLAWPTPLKAPAKTHVAWVVTGN